MLYPKSVRLHYPNIGVELALGVTVKSFFASLLGLKLNVGDRVSLAGGYEMEPRWLNGQKLYKGTCVAFIKGQIKQPAAVIELDHSISFEETTGNIVVLELRYADARWAKKETVHVELCKSMPENKPWQERKQGKWVESHANYSVI